MRITSELSAEGTLTIHLSKKLGISQHNEFKDAYIDKLEGVTKIDIDMKELIYMDSAALGMLLILREKAGGEDAKIHLINIGEEVKDILKTVNFQQLFQME